ncbi:MAG: hypothetical protein [Malazfec virus 1]
MYYVIHSLKTIINQIKGKSSLVLFYIYKEVERR